MSSRVVTIGDGVKLHYQKDPTNRRLSKLVKVNIPPTLKNKAQDIENKAFRLLGTMSFSKTGAPFVKRTNPNNSTTFQPLDKYLPRTGLPSLTTNKPKINYTRFTGSVLNPLRMPFNKASPPTIKEKPIEINGPSIMNMLGSILPTSPNRSKLPIANKLRNNELCMPQTFMYRSFKPGANKSYFNYVIARNNNGVRNLAPLPPNYSQMSPAYIMPGGGIARVAKGTEGLTFMGCMSNNCKEKVLIKASLANEPYRDSKPAMEFKINKEMYEKCKGATPHIVMPYVMNICKPEDAFLRPGRNIMNNKTTAKTRLAVGYYEFYNGGSLFSWMNRRSNTFTEKQLRTILFQVLWTMGVMYRKVPSFRHNDLHIQNILIRTGESVSKTGKTAYGKMFEVPNTGIMSAVGDFGWSKTNNRSHPNVNSGNFKNSHGISKNSTVRQDAYVFLASVYVFLMEYDRFSATKRFIEKVLGLKEDHVLTNIRLKANKKSIPSPEIMILDEYFKEFRVKKEEPKAPVVKKSKPPANNNLLRNIKQNIMSTKESSACGARTAPKQGGVRAMTVDQMNNFIKKEGTPAAQAALAVYKKKPTRKQMCYILTTFRAGRKLAGLTVAEVNNTNKPKNNKMYVALKRSKPITNMTKMELMNFVVTKGGNAPANATMKNLVRMARALGNNAPRRRPLKYTGASMMRVKGTREPVKREKPAVAPAANRLNATERRMLDIMTNRMYNKMPANGNENTRRSKARAAAITKMMNVRSRVRKMFNNNNHLGMNVLNNLASPVKRAAAPVRKPAPKAANIPAKNNNAPRARKVDARVNMFKYTMNDDKNAITPNKVVKTLRVQMGSKEKAELVRLMPRSKINRILRRVGIDPNVVKSKEKAATLIFSARKNYVRQRKTKKEEAANLKRFQEEISRNKALRNREELAKMEAARKMLQKKNAPSLVMVPKVIRPRGRLALMNSLGLRK